MPTADELLGADVVADLAARLAAAWPAGSTAAVRRCADELAGLGFGERGRAVRDAVLLDLPDGAAQFRAVIERALLDPGFAGWMIMPVADAVAHRSVADGTEAGLDAGLALLAVLTPRLTAEFALRAFLAADLPRTLDAALAWTAHPDEHVRRLASEGTRQRLPWGKRVPALDADPAATLPILDALYRDRSQYVRRSVANHLNDLSRADADLAVSVAERWLAAPDASTAALVRHALRTLVKRGDPDALGLLGFHPLAGVRVEGLTLDRDIVVLGESLGFACEIRNDGTAAASLAIDYIVHYRKANGSLAPKVFKLTTRVLEPGESVSIAGRRPFVPITTRTYHPGEHALEIQVNGQGFGRATFGYRATSLPAD